MGEPRERYRSYPVRTFEHFRQVVDRRRMDGVRCIARRDLEPFVDRDRLPDDPMLKVRQPDHPPERLQLPVEVVATGCDLAFWRENIWWRRRQESGTELGAAMPEKVL